MYGALDISTSALVANRVRMEVISANIANQGTLLNADGQYEPYQRRDVFIAPGDPTTGSNEGVHVAEIRLDEGPLRPRMEPGSPYADEDGYVYYPNVDPVVETMNAMEASRSYEANVMAIEATKAMTSIALEIIA
ncbi:MAG: flagellar basal body rod protein FlgC [Planctomycetota bacterium]